MNLKLETFFSTSNAFQLNFVIFQRASYKQHSGNSIDESRNYGRLIIRSLRNDAISSFAMISVAIFAGLSPASFKERLYDHLMVKTKENIFILAKTGSVTTKETRIREETTTVAKMSGIV